MEMRGLPWGPSVSESPESPKRRRAFCDRSNGEPSCDWQWVVQGSSHWITSNRRSLHVT